MFGGGEEYFQEPPSFDRDMLRRYATFCTRLTTLEKPSKKAIADAVDLAHAVGNTPQAYELVVGSLFRHIKSWTGKKQLTCWYVLDKLSKEDRDKYGYIAGKYILEIGRDYIPYEDPELAPKYESLVEHWESVFPRHVVDAIWMAKKERLWAIAHPAEVLEQQQAEEMEFEREELAMQDEDGLNLFGQPCIEYLQGRCMWGDQCRFLHPPGEEGSLPPECRMGDWKCFSCGIINRHFRRRCSNCVREKPQYKKKRAPAAEDVLLSTPDPVALQALSRQLGYNPYVEAQALQHWNLRFEHTTLQEYLEERRAAYKVRILGLAAQNALEERCRNQRHFPDVDIEPDEEYLSFIEAGATGDRGPYGKRARYESVVPSGTSASSAIALLSEMILERGVHDAMVPRLFLELAQQVRILAEEPSGGLSAAQAQALLSVAKLGFTAWNTNRGNVSFVASFFNTIHNIEDKIGLSLQECKDLSNMAKDF